MNYCSACGSDQLKEEIPAGDNRKRFCCKACGTIHYSNPKLVTGCLLTYEDKILLCERAIEPRKGFWTFPSGFMENGETAEEGAAREAYEEAYAEAKIDRLHLLYSLPHINQVYLIFAGELLNPDTVKAGEESLDVQLFSKDEIPYDRIAFTAVTKALELFFEDNQVGRPITHRSYYKK